MFTHLYIFRIYVIYPGTLSKIDFRFKDNELVSVMVTSAGSHLMLEGVTAASTGNYRCRANNDYSTVYSQVARLQVEGTGVYNNAQKTLFFRKYDLHIL